MTTIDLFIPDAALRDALNEQIAVQALGEPRAIANLAENQNSILIIDEAAFTATAFADWEKRADRPFLLFLGNDGPELASETFPKPLRLGHLMARLRYYVETAPLLRDRSFAFGPFRLEPQNRLLVRESDSVQIRLTEKETALLSFLAQSDAPVTRADILAAVWGYDERIDTHTLETHIYQLRRKLDADGENWLINENGAYRLGQKRS